MHSLAADPNTQSVAKLAADGLTIDAIAGRLQIHRSSVYRRMRAAFGRRRQPVTDQERARIVALLEEDHSRREVAEMTGRGLGTVARIGRSLQGPSQHRRLRSARRCPGCGHFVMIEPCVICAARPADGRTC